MKNFKNRIKNNGRVCNTEVMFFIPTSVGPLRSTTSQGRELPSVLICNPVCTAQCEMKSYPLSQATKVKSSA